MSALQVVDTRICNAEAEVALLAALLCEPKVIDQVADRLPPEDFSDPFLGFVYGTILREAALGHPLNPITIRPIIESEPGFEEMGGRKWLANMATQQISVIGATSFAAQIAEMAQRQRLVEGLREAIALAADFDKPVADVVQAADGALALASDRETGRGEMSGADAVARVIDNFSRPLGGVTCGKIPSFDRAMGPARAHHLDILAGRPGMGKTATAISYALGAAERGHGVAFYSLEMSGEELGERIAADMCCDRRIPYEKIRDRELNADQQREVCRAQMRLAEMPFQIIDRAGMRLSALRSSVRRWKRRFEARGHKLELVIVDYLQLLRPDRNMDRYEAVSEISRTLKEIAKSENLCVLALAQLSREVEKRDDKRPRLSDLKESGQIEQDADAIVFLLRDEYYLRQAEPHLNDPKREAWEAKLQDCLGRIEFICAKRRGGATGSAFGEFLYHFQAVR